MEGTHLARSNPLPSSSSSSSSGRSFFVSGSRRGGMRPVAIPLAVPGLLGLARFGGGGLLLGILPSPSPGSPFSGLMSGTGRAGVLPMSANFQNCAGELMGINLDGICAVLGGGSRGCWRCGAGVIIDDGPSS